MGGEEKVLKDYVRKLTGQYMIEIRNQPNVYEFRGETKEGWFERKNC